MRLHQDLPGATTQQRRISYKLDCVAVAMKRSNHNSLLVEWESIPQSIGIGRASGFNRITLPPGALEFAEQHPAPPTSGSAFGHRPALNLG
jgi:hypothetical protein